MALFMDEPDVVVREASDDITRLYDLTLRQPALPLAERWPMVAAFDSGVATDLVAFSLALGHCWQIGPATEATGPTVIWLTPLELPYEHQIAAWWLGAVGK